MIHLLKKFIRERMAAIAVEFSIALIIYMTLLLILIDLMMIIGQWADVQRANALMAELIKNRISPIVAAGYDGTETSGTTYVSVYCSLLVFSALCDNIVIYVSTTNTNLNINYIPGSGDLVYCYSKNMSCDINTNSFPLTNKSNVVLITTNVKPYRITKFNYITNTIFGKNISSTNIATLNN